MCVCVCVYTHTYSSQQRDADGAKEIQIIWTAVSAACQENLSVCHFGHACHRFTNPPLKFHDGKEGSGCTDLLLRKKALNVCVCVCVCGQHNVPAFGGFQFTGGWLSLGVDLG